MEFAPAPRSRLSAALYTRATGRITQIAERAVDQFVAEIPFYAVLPTDVVHGETTESVTAALSAFLRALRDGTAPTSEELAIPLAAAAHRAQEQVPLAVVLTAYHIAARVGWEALLDLAEQDELPEVLAAGSQVLRYLQGVVPAVADVYLEERQAIHGEEREARRALVSALLTGQPSAALAERLQIDLAPAYAVLHLHVVTGADDGASARSAVAARSRARRSQSALDEFAGQPVLSALDSRGGTALIPATGETTSAVLADVPRLVARIADAIGHGVIAGAALAETVDAVPQAAGEAGEVATLAARLGHPSGLYLLDDLLLEYQITRPGAARARLAAKLAELAEHPHLLDALRSWVAQEHNRRRAARDLHIHPNTLDYRLSRVGQLTGLDPQQASDARILAAALLIHTVTSESD